MCKIAGCEERPGTNAPASNETLIDTDSYNRANLARECRTNEQLLHCLLGQLVIRQAMLLPREKEPRELGQLSGFRSITEQKGFVAAGPAGKPLRVREICFEWRAHRYTVYARVDAGTDAWVRVSLGL